VGNAVGQGHHRAGGRHRRRVADVEPDLAVEHVHDLVLLVVDVQRRTEAAGRRELDRAHPRRRLPAATFTVAR
jgi:hypothetical protein